MHEQFLQELAALGASLQFAVVLDAGKLADSFSSDRSHHEPCTPGAAVLPTTVAQVSKVVALCFKYKVPMTPRGAGTGLEGGCIPQPRSCVIDTSLLNRFDLDRENSLVWVGAGLKKLDVVRRAKKEGFHFGPDPASNPSVGGMCSTGGSGMSTLKYGTTRENVLSLIVVTPDGSIVKTRQAVRKCSTGLDLTQLYCGSEGTLGIVCEICFRLHPLQQHIAGGFAEFDATGSAVKSVVEVRRLGKMSSLVRCELLNAEAVLAANKEFGTTLRAVPTVLFEFCDSDPALREVETDFARLRSVFEANGCGRVEFIRDAKQLEDIWEARRGCLMAAGKFRGRRGEKLLNTDVCVPLSALAATVVETEADFKAAGIPCIICAHIADGNFHCLIPYNNAAEKQTVLDLEGRMVRRAIVAGGSASGEHGVGVGKVKHLLAEHGPTHIGIQESIKAALDPHNLMNPGVFYPSQVAKYQQHKL